MKLHLGVKSDPIEYRYSFPWLFRIMAGEGVRHLQLGSFFEAYSLPDSYWAKLRKQADDHGIVIDSLFTAHRELGGFFREDPEWVEVARKNYARFIEVGGLLGARSVGSNPGAVPRDLIGTKEAGLACYIEHLKELMHFAKEQGVEWLTVEPMSCLAEPPTLPEEMAEMGTNFRTYHEENPDTTAQVGFCTDIAHGYLNQKEEHGFTPMQLFEASLPWLYEIHLKNTDHRYHSTFGFEPANLEKGIIDVREFRRVLLERANEVPVDTMVGYLEIGGPKHGRDFTDGELEGQLRQSLQYLKSTWLQEDETEAEAKVSTVEVRSAAQPRSVQIAPSMMCVDPLNFESALRRVEALGVDMLHLDVMDASFVPNMPMGLGVVEALRDKTARPLDVHLMVSDNDFFLQLLEGKGVDRISVHAESCPHLDRTLTRIREIGAKAGLAINPSTPLDILDHVLERLDFVLVMTVNPGFAGQKMTPGSIAKIKSCREKLDTAGFEGMEIQVDGNVSFANIPKMVAAGADNLVAGTSSIFHRDGSWAENLVRLEAAITEGKGA